MEKGFEEIEKIYDSNISRLASIQHDVWAHWQSYLHSQCVLNDDGSLTIPKELVEHWERQIKTAYEDLSLEERESDDNQVKKSKSIILTMLLEAKKIK